MMFRRRQRVSYYVLIGLLWAAPMTASARHASGWVVTNAMHAVRYGHTATLLFGGTVLVVGGYDNANGPSATDHTLSSAEMYDPRTRTWTLTGSLHAARQYHTAMLLRSGQVLVAGGYGRHTLATAELYDPRTGRWTPTGRMAVARGEDTATLLADGRVLVVGGSADGTRARASAEIYDPATGRWTATRSMATGRYNQTATLLPGGAVLVAGGRDNHDVTLASAELYNPRTGRWTRTGAMHNRRWTHAAVLLRDGRVLVAGDAEFTFAELAAHPYLASFILTHHPSAELYDPRTGTWTVTGGMVTRRSSETATLLPDGRVLVAGGVCVGTSANDRPTDPRCLDPLASAEVYDSRTQTWTVTASMHIARSGLHSNATATLLLDGRVLVAGGESDSHGAQLGAEVYTP